MMRRSRRGRPEWKACDGFTLVEIILVVSIILILAGVVATNVTGQSRRAKINITKIKMQTIKTALNNYDSQVGQLPTTDQGLDALITRPGEVSAEDWGKKPYLEDYPRDVWGTKFKYACPSAHEGREFDLISAGPDRKFDTEDDIGIHDPRAADREAQ